MLSITAQGGSKMLRKGKDEPKTNYQTLDYDSSQNNESSGK